MNQNMPSGVAKIARTTMRIRALVRGQLRLGYFVEVA